MPAVGSNQSELIRLRAENRALFAQIESLQGENRVLRIELERIKRGLHGVSCEIHADWSTGCSECRIAELQARIVELEAERCG